MPPTRRVIYRRRRVVVFGILLVLLTGFGYLAATGFAPVPTSAAVLAQPASATQAIAAPTWPGIGSSAIGAVGFEGVLASSGSQGVVPMASITKMVTALVVLDKKPISGNEPGPDITFTDQDVNHYYSVLAEGGSAKPVVSGMVLTERQTLQAMILPSANNYAQSLAVWAFGSVEEYLSAADRWLADNDLDDTFVADPSGISTKSVSSPADLVALGKLVVDNPTTAAIVAQPTVKLPVIGDVKNTNKLLGSFGVDGIKTGTTDAAGACLLFSTDLKVGKKTVTVVGVVLGGDTQSAVARAVGSLIQSVTPGFREVELTKKGASFADYSTPWGQTSRAVAAEAASVLVWSDTKIDGVATARSLTLGTKGESVGSVEFAVGEETVNVPLVLESEITDPGPAWRFSHPGELAAAD